MLKDIDMKSLILGFLLGIVTTMAIGVFMVDVAMAISLPCPILLDIDTVPEINQKGLHVELRDDRGVPILSGVTNEDGEVQFELGGVASCTEYTAIILECENEPACQKVVSFNPSGVTFWDLTHIELPCPPCPDCPTTTTIPVTTTVPLHDRCEDEGYLLPGDCPECELDLREILIAIFSLVGGGAFIYVTKGGKIKLKKESLEKLIDAMPNGTGIRITKAYNGKGSIKHWHRSPKTYHNLEDRHKEGYDHKGEENLFPDFKE